jgi:hypothetical protein
MSDVNNERVKFGHDDEQPGDGVYRHRLRRSCRQRAARSRRAVPGRLGLIRHRRCVTLSGARYSRRAEDMTLEQIFWWLIWPAVGALAFGGWAYWLSRRPS